MEFSYKHWSMFLAHEDDIQSHDGFTPWWSLCLVKEGGKMIIVGFTVADVILVVRKRGKIYSEYGRLIFWTFCELQTKDIS